MNRRGFLKGLLALPAAPLIAKEVVELTPAQPGPLTTMLDAMEVVDAGSTTITVGPSAMYNAGDTLHVVRTGENFTIRGHDTFTGKPTFTRGSG